VGTGVLLLGAVYWLVWTKVWPWWGGDDGMVLVGADVGGEDGETAFVYGKSVDVGRSLLEGVEEPLLGGRSGSKVQGYNSID
jgi:hypothetical protein